MSGKKIYVKQKKNFEELMEKRPEPAILRL